MTQTRTRTPEDRRADFESTVLQEMQTIYNCARRLARGDEDDAGDLVQETCLRAYRTFDNFTPGTNCRAWLLTIMYSVFYNQHDKATRRGPTVSVDELEERFHNYLESPHDTTEAASTADVRGTRMNVEVAGALDGLPPDFRDPILLVDVDGLSYDEAAVALGCPVGTIRSRLFRGRKLLFSALADYASAAGFTREKP